MTRCPAPDATATRHPARWVHQREFRAVDTPVTLGNALRIRRRSTSEIHVIAPFSVFGEVPIFDTMEIDWKTVYRGLADPRSVIGPIEPPLPMADRPPWKKTPPDPTHLLPIRPDSEVDVAEGAAANALRDPVFRDTRLHGSCKN